MMNDENTLQHSDSNEKRKQALKTVLRFSAMNTGLKPITGYPEDDEACAERLAQFFKICDEEGYTPTWELLATYLGISRFTLHDWEKNRYRCTSDTRIALLQQAKEMLAAYDAQLVTNGQMNPTTYIFRSKNYYGMKDQVESVQIVHDDEAIKSIEQIKAEMKLLTEQKEG